MRKGNRLNIDRNQLYQDTLLWLPSSNTLSEHQTKAVNEHVIKAVGDDDEKYPEVLCKALRALANVNLSKATADTEGLKREKVDGEELEWFSAQGASTAWRNYIKTLDEDICPIFGYTEGRKGFGIKITTSNTPNINPCDDDALYYY